MHKAGATFRMGMVLLGLAAVGLAALFRRRWRLRVLLLGVVCTTCLAALFALKPLAQDLGHAWLEHPARIRLGIDGLALVIVWGATVAFSVLVMVIRRK